METVRDTEHENTEDAADDRGHWAIDIDRAHEKLTVRGIDGATHELQASKETLQGYKVGDRLEVKLRSPRTATEEIRGPLAGGGLDTRTAQTAGPAPPARPREGPAEDRRSW